ncbi:tetratricopeptide repeat-containing sensor histidine kinase [Croceitalea rosinachiae]|uniref:Tetratricopeptide repeat protein n=1 Tax=Croceitalea rosinachiae TaxID=3075596 RepID=A0ABU3A851_9FLAO|nr:tetratricopeptide repeat protein [Croceitalea sp. F388]MDT0606063.1 tetratricopeptide repeat protein [Croceitalea sp. F388]
MGLIFFAIGCFGVSQTNAEDISPEVEKLLIVKPKTYLKIDKALKPHRRDTSFLKAFIQKAITDDYSEGQMYALNQMGTTFRNFSEFRKAIKLHQDALKLSEELNNKEFIVLSLNMLGVVYRRTDAVKTALDYNQRALELAESVENPSEHIKRHINISLNCIGLLYQTLGQYDLAISQFERALKSEAKLDNKLGLAINNQNIGKCYEQKEELEIALDFYRKSLALNDEINNNYGRLICKNSIAQIYLKQNMPNAALVLLQTLKEPAVKNGDKSLTSSILINTGWAQMEVGILPEAEKNIVNGRKMAIESSVPSLVMYANKHLSDLEIKKGNLKAALDYFKNAEEIDEEITNERNLRYINDLILRYESEKKNSQISVLAQENELVRLRLRKNQTTILVSTLIIGLIGTILFIMYRQYQSNYEKRVLGLEQHMLRSQMNPHFLFNSLNSIKLYIINNDKKNAVHYLNKFSKLVRRILEGSSLKETLLSEELETVELYLNIENIRFSNEIEYVIEIEDDINVDQVKIPSLVLQPFLENAIWHGLSGKEGKKNLWITVKKKDDIHLQISIVDNGVGRKVSEEIKENRILKRKSVGIDITKERLANFAKDYQYDFNIDIIDLFEDNGKSRGTKIILEIPMV